MKINKLCITLLIAATPGASNGAIASVFTGFNVAFVDIANTPIPSGSGFITAGFFDGLNDSLIPTSDISTIDTAFTPFTASTGVFGFNGYEGFADFVTTGERVGATSPFINQSLYFVFGNGTDLLSSSQLAVFKSDLTFPDDSAAAVDADLTVELGGATPTSGSFIMGTTGGTVEILSTNIPSVQMAEVVPEPSTLLLSALGCVALFLRKR